MKKRLFCILILVCLVCSLVCACETKKEITGDQALAIVLEELGDDYTSVSAPHIHTGTYEDQNCYNIYITVKGESWVYMVSVYGEILYKGPGGHSH